VSSAVTSTRAGAGGAGADSTGETSLTGVLGSVVAPELDGDPGDVDELLVGVLVEGGPVVGVWPVGAFAVGLRTVFFAACVGQRWCLRRWQRLRALVVRCCEALVRVLVASATDAPHARQRSPIASAALIARRAVI
jgi:hypothetical protein